ncbi:MAG: hybrid sensor histidine kinase/response regulator [Candidatus Gastranaerophilales bacterium]|nr:hybrid sensor histidine kinase/response regulator [Candidatus Gastranaerophilales bacterium]
MLIKEKYVILDDIPETLNLNTELCILNYNIIPVLELTIKLIKHNQNVTFWVATKDFSKEYVQTASRLGVKNIIPLPIKTELIDDFFVTKNEFYNDENGQNFSKLENSKVLIVDDNELNVKLLSEVLCDLGIQITTCLNPMSSLELIKTEKFDLFLLDILMPNMSGFELAEEIKKTNKNLNTPIIFISAISGTENILNGYNLGACSYIEKPFHPNIVKSQIYNILKSEENKREIEREKEHFVATLTHDLKSPINAEISALKYLLKKNPDEIKTIQNELLSDLLNSAKYMQLITDKILCHYKQKNNKVELHKEDTEFAKLIISSIEETKYLAGEKDIRICFSDNTDNDTVRVDSIEIKRVLNNLISNAIEYSNKNGIIDIILEKEGKNFIFTIQDYGIGIDLSNKGNVFDEYVTFSKQQKRTGFGLGLNICQKIVEAHNGRISISSLPETGTTITFSIPE